MAVLSNLAHHHHFVSLNYHHNYTSFSFHTNHTIHFNANNNNSILCFASTNKSRASRKIMSDEELHNGLKEFVASVGLPDGHIPSTKELNQHGRKDLANIVRRRGHKLIKELLDNATVPATDEYDLLENLTEEVSESQDHEVLGQEEKVSDAVDESNDLINDETAIGTSLAMGSKSVDSADSESTLSVDSRVALQEKVEKFIKFGQLDSVDDKEENLVGLEQMIHDKRERSHFIHDSSSTGSNGTLVMGTSVSPPITEEIYTSEIHLSSQNQQNTDFDPEMSCKASEMDNEDDINNLKRMLHQKELELSRLKEDIEKEKKALSILQTKAEDEISKAQKLITEKEAELLSAEESLSGLVEAKIQYSGEGETVEVAGSFNGWHQRLKMDPQISSVTVDPTDSRTSKLWSATLWLYPGVYEMKFIVDGQWKIDPQRELTIKHGVENNILRVNP